MTEGEPVGEPRYVDVIGREPRQRSARSPLLLVVAGLALLVGAGAGVVGAESRLGRGTPPVQLAQGPAQGGLVTVCDGRARAFIYARGLPDEAIPVRLPLGVEGALLPLMTDRAIVLSGRLPVSLVGFVPEDGQLALVQELPVPPGASVAVEVGDRALRLPVRGCGRGER